MFIEERLEALHEIDSKVVSLLDRMSAILETYTAPRAAGDSAGELRERFAQQTRDVYQLVSTVAIDLRKEVRVMDDNIGHYDRNDDGVMILPISVDQKNSRLGASKMRHELEQMQQLMSQEPPRGAKPEEASEEPSGAAERKTDQASAAAEAPAEVKREEDDVDMLF
ncbi:Mediator of RNA polymerase II transcription subunit 11 [[Candida] zeylanoides]